MGEACDGYFKVVIVVFADVLDQVDAVDESALDSCPFVLTGWRVPAKGENVAASVFLGFLFDFGDESVLVGWRLTY